MKMLDEVIKACEETVSDVDRGLDIEGCYLGATETRDALYYLKEYRKQKYIWRKLYLLAHQMFWGLEEEYPLDGERIANDLFDAYSEGFEDENA